MFMVQDMLVLSAKVSSEYVICRVLFETKNQFYKIYILILQFK